MLVPIKLQMPVPPATRLKPQMTTFPLLPKATSHFLVDTKVKISCNRLHHECKRDIYSHRLRIDVRERQDANGVRRLEKRVAVLIGAAVGIGRGIAERLVQDGALVVIGDADEHRGLRTAAELGLDQRQFVHADVADERDVESVAARAAELFGGIDIMIQNAGIYPASLISDTAVSDWDRVMAVNLRGAFICTRACLPAMKDRGGGRMIFTSSITGPRVVSHGLASYAASKAGINGFIKVAALEFAALGICVNGVEPGNVSTEGLQSGRSPQSIKSMERSIPMGRLGTPRDIAGVVSFLASDDAAYVTGTTIIVDGGQTLPENKDFYDPSTWF